MVSGTYRSRPPFGVVTWPFQSDRWTQICRLPRSTAFDHGVDRPPRCAQKIRRVVHREQNGQRRRASHRWTNLEAVEVLAAHINLDLARLGFLARRQPHCEDAILCSAEIFVASTDEGSENDRLKVPDCRSLRWI